MVPHSIVTVSLATAMLPRLSAHAADGDLRGAGAARWRARCAPRSPWSCRSRAAARVAPDLARWSSRTAPRPTAASTPTCRSLSLFGLGLLFFTVHYLVLRGFYALELNRTVFFVQCVVAATNIVAAVALVAATDGRAHLARAGVAYAASYAVGSVVSYLLLRRRLGGLRSRRLLRFLAAGWPSPTGLATGAAVRRVAHGPATAWPTTPGHLVAAVAAGLRGRPSTCWSSWCCARLLRITEVTEVVDTRHPSAAGLRRVVTAPYDGLGPPGTRLPEEPEGSTRAARDPARRRARRPVPAGRPAQRERGRPVLARPRPRPRAPRRAARHRAPTTSGPSLLLDAARTLRHRPRPADAAGPRRRPRPTDVCFVVNEWGSGTSLDIMLASDGPLVAAARRLAGQRGGRLDRGRPTRRRRPRPAGRPRTC